MFNSTQVMLVPGTSVKNIKLWVFILDLTFTCLGADLSLTASKILSVQMHN